MLLLLGGYNQDAVLQVVLQQSSTLPLQISQHDTHPVCNALPLA